MDAALKSGSRKRSRNGSPMRVWRNIDSGVDCLSELPDEIICSILSRLPLKEATRSCVLSRRWKKLWTHSIGPDLVFYDSDIRFKLLSDGKYEDEDMMRSFVGWVNHILELKEHQTINEITIRYSLDSSCSHFIDAWITFAIIKGVKRLELDFKDLHPPPKCYALTHKALFTLCSAFCNLRDLSLSHMFVDGKVIKYLLSSSLSLERMCLRSLAGIGQLKVTCQTSKLKQLEISFCPIVKIGISSPNLVVFKLFAFSVIKKVKISAPNLTLLHYDGPITALRLKSIPLLLSELSTGGKYCESLLKELSMHFNYVSQLKILKLEISEEMGSKSVWFPLYFPKFSKLEQLEITMYAHDKQCLLWLIVLIKAAPLLLRLTVKLEHWREPDISPMCSKSVYKDGQTIIRQNMKEPHQCLKVVQLTGFTTPPNHQELAKHLFYISQSSKMVVVETGYWYVLCSQGAMMDCSSHDQAMEYYKELAKKLLSGVEFVVI